MEDYLKLFSQLFCGGEIEIRTLKETVVYRGTIGDIKIERGRVRFGLINFEKTELGVAPFNTPNKWRSVKKRAYSVTLLKTTFRYLPSHIEGIWAGLELVASESCHTVKLILPNHVGRNPFTTHAHDVHSEHQ